MNPATQALNCAEIALNHARRSPHVSDVYRKMARVYWDIYCDLRAADDPAWSLEMPTPDEERIRAALAAR